MHVHKRKINGQTDRRTGEEEGAGGRADRWVGGWMSNADTHKCTVACVYKNKKTADG